MSIRVPTLPGDARYDPPFEYVCSGGHHIGAEHAITRCPIIGHAPDCTGPADPRCGPCTGELTRVGKGSRTGQAVDA